MALQPAALILACSAYAKVDQKLYLLKEEDKELIRENWEEGDDTSPGLTVARNVEPNTPVAYMVRRGDNAQHLAIYLSKEGGKVTVAASRLDTDTGTPSFVHQDLPEEFRSHVNANITQNMRLSGQFVDSGALVIFQDNKNILHGYLLRPNSGFNAYEAEKICLVDSTSTTKTPLVAKGPHILLVHEKVVELHYWDGIYIRRMISDPKLLSSWKSEDEFLKPFKRPVDRFLILSNDKNDLHVLVLYKDAEKQLWWDHPKCEAPLHLGKIENGRFIHASKEQSGTPRVLANLLKQGLALILPHDKHI